MYRNLNFGGIPPETNPEGVNPKLLASWCNYVKLFSEVAYRP